MTVKVRSIDGNNASNVTNLSVALPATVNVGDRIVVRVLCNSDSAQSVTPDKSLALADQVSDATAGTSGTRVMEFSKIADSADAAAAGGAWFTISGFDGSVDILWLCLALYDDGGGQVAYVTSSLAGLEETGGGTTSDAPGATIGNDGSLAFPTWAARDGTAQFQIDVGETFAPTGGANATIHNASLTSNVMSGSEWTVATVEFDIADSPTGALQLSHNSLAADVDVYSATSVYEASTGPAPTIDAVGPAGTDTVFDNELRVDVTGSGFGASGATVNLYDTDPLTTTPGTTVAQTVKSQSDTALVIEVDGTGLTPGTVYLGVTPSGGSEQSHAVTLKADPGASAVGKRADPADQVIEDGVAFSFDASAYLFASDAQDSLDVSVSGAPPGLGFDGATLSGVVSIGAAAGSPYTVLVDAVDRDGNSAPQDSFSITVAAQTPPTVLRDRRPQIRTIRAQGLFNSGV